MAIDRLDWHADSAIEAGLGHEDAATHIGFYLTWIIVQDLVAEIHRTESTVEIQKIKDREITGRDFVIEICDEKFWEEDLNQEGLAFTQYYYENGALYFTDYAEVLTVDAESIYAVENTWANYDLIASRINQRYQQWKTISDTASSE